MKKQIDWSTIRVEVTDLYEYEIFAVEGRYTDGTPLTEGELEHLDLTESERLYDIALDDAIAAAEFAFDGDR